MGVRIGEQFPLFYQWYIKGEKVGDCVEFKLNDGDMYIMEENAVGTNWKKEIFIH